MATYKFTVEGSGAFPEHMLRDDDGYAETNDERWALCGGALRKVSLVGQTPPHMEAWARAGWPLVEIVDTRGGGAPGLQARATVATGYGGRSECNGTTDRPPMRAESTPLDRLGELGRAGGWTLTAEQSAAPWTDARLWRLHRALQHWSHTQTQPAMADEQQAARAAVLELAK